LLIFLFAEYQLVIIYADRDMSSQWVTKLQNYKRLFIAEKNLDLYKDYLLKKLICEDSSSAAFADFEQLVDHKYRYGIVIVLIFI